MTSETSVEELNKQLIESYHQMIDEQCLKLSSIVWIAAKCNDQAMITIIDSNKAEKIIDTFPLGKSIIYAMGSVPGRVIFWVLEKFINDDILVGSSNTDYPAFDDSKWTLFEADTASASGKKKKKKAVRVEIDLFYLDVKIAPCTVASLSTGASKIIDTWRVERKDTNGILIGRPIPSEAMSSELKTTQQDLAVPRMYSIIDEKHSFSYQYKYFIRRQKD